jgi:hypothetical protein
MSMKETIGKVERSKGSHQLTGTVLMTMVLIIARTREHHQWGAHSFSVKNHTKKIYVIYNTYISELVDSLPTGSQRLTVMIHNSH